MLEAGHAVQLAEDLVVGGVSGPQSCTEQTRRSVVVGCIHDRTRMGAAGLIPEAVCVLARLVQHMGVDVVAVASIELGAVVLAASGGVGQATDRLSLRRHYRSSSDGAKLRSRNRGNASYRCSLGRSWETVRRRSSGSIRLNIVGDSRPRS